MPQFGTFTDSFDGHVYRTVLMPDGKWWFAEDREDNYWGNLFWVTYPPPVPDGCHSPTEAEWNAMFASVANPETVGRDLRSASSWETTIQSLDQYGFNAKPSGWIYYDAELGLGSPVYREQGTGAGWLLGFDSGVDVNAPDFHNFVYLSGESLVPQFAKMVGFWAFAFRYIVDSGNVPDNIPDNPFQILTPCTLQMLCDSKVANSSSGRRRTVSRDSSFVFSATLNLPSECEQFEAVPYYNFPAIGDCEIRQLDLVKYTFRDTEKTSSVKCVIVPNIMQKRTGDFRISCEPNISMDEAMLVATGSSSLEVLSSSRSLSLKCVWTVSFLAATQFIEWLRGSVNRIFTTSVGGMKGVACQIGNSVSLEIGSTDVKISADLAIVNTKQFPLNVTASRVGNVVTVSTGTAYTGTLVNRSGEIVEVVTTATNVLTFTTYPENCYLLIREGNNVTEWLEL